jgi:hypothetical protein
MSGEIIIRPARRCARRHHRPDDETELASRCISGVAEPRAPSRRPAPAPRPHQFRHCFCAAARSQGERGESLGRNGAHRAHISRPGRRLEGLRTATSPRYCKMLIYWRREVAGRAPTTHAPRASAIMGPRGRRRLDGWSRTAFHGPAASEGQTRARAVRRRANQAAARNSHQRRLVPAGGRQRRPAGVNLSAHPRAGVCRICAAP